jgi:hypothetical protein
MDTKLVGTSKVNEHPGHHDDGLPLAERKTRLLRQAEFHRQNIISAKSAIKQGAHPQAIFHNALDHATFALRNRVDMVLHPTGVNVSTLAPYALSLLAFLRQRRLVKPALGVAAAAAGLAAYVKYRRSHQLRH